VTVASIESQLSATARRDIRRRLMTWYRRNARDLPWRRRPGDGYAQWIAEIMLQQTQVETVKPYYDRFITRFPDSTSLARASEDELLRHWQGLGYYRRAANLHAAAKRIVASGGVFPDTFDALIALPGIGRYTAGAVASIAFDRRVSAVDGNVIRVLARLFHITDDISKPATLRRFQSLADALLPRDHCGDFNQAWMDLGAAICTPKSPRCDACPLKTPCLARHTENVQDLPYKRKANAVPVVEHVAVVARQGNAILFTKRPSKGLWSGLWELPNEVTNGDTGAQLDNILTRYGLQSCETFSPVGSVSHRLTHRMMVFALYTVDATRDDRTRNTHQPTKWVTPGRLKNTPMSTACRKMLAVIASA
jgi:A/G-specific adenine glycosylase